MALDRRRVAQRSVDWQRALLVLGNAIPIAAVAAGYVSLLEAAVVYLLEPPIVGASVAIELLVVDQPPGERSRRLLEIDRDWLARPIRITRWSLGAAARYLGQYVLVCGFVYLIVAALVLTLVAQALAAGAATSIVVLAAGFAIGRLVDLGRFLLGHDGRRAAPEALRERSELELRRLQLLSVCYVVFAVAALGLHAIVSSGLAVAVVFVALKTGVDLLFHRRIPAAAQSATV